MARVAGQVDETKTEAILDAAQALFAERGGQTTMEAIARAAGVSRQTLYNRFPSKIDIGRALASRRSAILTAQLQSGGDTRTVLTAYALTLLNKLCVAPGPGTLRGVALMSPTAPELARAIYRAGPAEGLRQLSAWLAQENRAGRLSIPEPDAAAEMFSGMVMGHGHLRMILDIETPAFDPQARAADVADRFMKAFSLP